MSEAGGAGNIGSGRRRIFLLRHGEVTYFDPSGRPFRPDTVPLNEEGRGQARAAARVLEDVPIDRVVSSDLRRCIETAGELIEGRGLTLEISPEFREIQPGRLSDLPVDKIAEIFTGAFGAGVRRESQFLGGETFGSLLDRVLPRFDRLLEEPGWKNLVLVAHGAVNRAILTRALGSGLSGFGAIEQDAACLNILDVDESGRSLVRLVNFTPYNLAKTGLELTTMERLFLAYQARG